MMFYKYILVRTKPIAANFYLHKKLKILQLYEYYFTFNELPKFLSKKYLTILKTPKRNWFTQSLITFEED